MLLFFPTKKMLLFFFPLTPILGYHTNKKTRSGLRVQDPRFSASDRLSASVSSQPLRPRAKFARSTSHCESGGREPERA